MRLGQSSNLASLTNFYEAARRQVPYATALALNRVAEAVRGAITDDIRSVFDRPTAYTVNSVRWSRATRDRLEARIDFKDGAGKGIEANKYLGPQVFGGARSQKRSERALQRVGLPGGAFTAPGGAAELDAYGNVSRGQIVRLLSYLQAFGEEGYRANSTARSRARTAKVGKSEGGFKRINGVVYFVSKGRGSMAGNHRQVLPAGVWRKTGVHGADVAPVLVATQRAPTYTPRLPFYETADRVFGERFDAEYGTAIEHALATAR